VSVVSILLSPSSFCSQPAKINKFQEKMGGLRPLFPAMSSVLKNRRLKPARLLPCAVHCLSSNNIPFSPCCRLSVVCCRIAHINPPSPSPPPPPDDDGGRSSHGHIHLCFIAIYFTADTDGFPSLATPINTSIAQYNTCHVIPTARCVLPIPTARVGRRKAHQCTNERTTSFGESANANSLDRN
jgi:hypothetical protein